MDRIESLQKLLKATPNDAFLTHALALEYIKLNDWKMAAFYFENNLTTHPEYVATYYHYGKLKEQTNQIADAINLYQSGIALAQQQQDFKTKSELEAALTFVFNDE